MAYQAKAYKAKTDWKAEDATLTSPGGKSIKPSGMVFKKPPGDDTTKGQVEMTFHGSPGWVSMRPTSAKTLIC
jgi:hypothetical protein